MYRVDVCMEGCWIPGEVEGLREGDLFRMYHDNVLVRKNDIAVFRATKDATLDKEAGVWVISIEE